MSINQENFRINQANFRIWPYAFIVFVELLGNGIIYPILGPLLFGHYDHSLSATYRALIYGLTSAIPAALMFIFTPWIGNLSDHFGRYKLLLLCLLGTSSAYLICGLGLKWKSWELFLFGRAIGGIAVASVTLAQAAVVDQLKENKSKGLSILVFWQAFGIIIGAALASFFAWSPEIFNNNWSLIFFALAFLGATSLITTWIYGKELNQTLPQGKVKLKMTESLSELFSTLENRRTLLDLTLFLLFSTSWQLLLQYVPMYLTRVLHYTELHLGILFTITGFGLILGLYLTKIALDHKIFEKKLIIFSCLTMIISSFLFSTTTTMLSVAIPSMIFSIGNVIGVSAFTTKLSNDADKYSQGKILSAVNCVAALGIFLAGGILSFPLQDGSTFPYIVTAAGALASILAYLLIKVKVQEKIKKEVPSLNITVSNQDVVNLFTYPLFSKLSPYAPAFVSLSSLTFTKFLLSAFASLTLIMTSGVSFLPVVIVSLFLFWLVDTIDGSVFSQKNHQTPLRGFLDQFNDLFSKLTLMFAIAYHFELTGYFILLTILLRALVSCTKFLSLVYTRKIHLTWIGPSFELIALICFLSLAYQAPSGIPVTIPFFNTLGIEEIKPILTLFISYFIFTIGVNVRLLIVTIKELNKPLALENEPVDN